MGENVSKNNNAFNKDLQRLKTQILIQLFIVNMLNKSHLHFYVL